LQRFTLVKTVITEIVFLGHVPSKKNSKRIVRRGDRTFSIPSEAHEAWHLRELPTLKGTVKLYPPYSITATFCPGDLKDNDLSNKIESINDLLVDAGIIEDDNWFGATTVLTRFGAIDIDNPRVEVMIESSDTETTIAQLKEAIAASVKVQRKQKAKLAKAREPEKAKQTRSKDPRRKTSAKAS
jgi:Holliday junction resolvase RusA-like endonuclease